MNMNVDEAVVPAADGLNCDYKGSVTDCKGKDVAGDKSAAVAVGDAAVTIVSEERCSGANRAPTGQVRRKVVRRSGVLQGRKRWGKIARMPLEAREWLNVQMRDGVRYKDLSAALERRGFAGVTKFDLSDWRYGGHEEWLRDQERLAAMRGDVERVLKVVEHVSEGESDGVELVNELLIGLQVAHALQDLHRGTLKDLVQKKPELLFRVARVASEQARDRARRKRVKLLGGRYGERSLMEKEDLSGGVGPGTLAKIEAALARVL